ncbi:PBECR2 nuclease fold domain-containing protein [Acerihabitans sp. TG2]|uniref:PBECR2 nuclease fold domain-containing protein n=1 Tax=Acerihabitans sp. TG2 TaxID=3096008 RepID=UPI002B22AE77|nr:PBECR2 nuclease fold domain-containing protein [Acerihabitans sp. TG2]MEA9390447.1 PBECR2 nuclease fold domain-containing protein [Acerihabitans sp. TG2]
MNRICFSCQNTHIGTLSILRSNLVHIVEKRIDARERYVLLALDTLDNPYEIWETMYDDHMVRYIFIGASHTDKNSKCLL